MVSDTVLLIEQLLITLIIFFCKKDHTYHYG
jgi:hypothetical protein